MFIAVRDAIDLVLRMGSGWRFLGGGIAKKYGVQS